MFFLLEFGNEREDVHVAFLDPEVQRSMPTFDVVSRPQSLGEISGIMDDEKISVLKGAGAQNVNIVYGRNAFTHNDSTKIAGKPCCSPTTCL